MKIEDERFAIWSNEHLAWWNPNHSGYTNNFMKAGRYSYVEARQIYENSNGWKQNNQTPDEVMVRVK